MLGNTNAPKKWKVAKVVSQKISDKFPEVHPIVLQLLVNRGLITQERIDQFLTPDYSSNLHDPFLFADMEKAATRILTAIQNQEKIVVYGDYDADGVCSSAVMVEFLKTLGANVDIYIPYRLTEGYGMNTAAVTKIADEGAKLVVTVDCGISNAMEAKVLKDHGVDLIITDHHHAPEILPEAFAIINPNVPGENYPFKQLCGSGVAYKVVQALVARHKNFQVTQLEVGAEKWLLDIVAIGTVADLMSVLDENRVLVKYGLVVLEKTRRLGLQELIASLGNKTNRLDEKTIGWQIAPRLNAAGRLNHASTAYELLITTDKSRAVTLTEELAKTNQQRQSLTEKIIAEALDKIGEIKDQKLLSAVGKDWPTGVVGLVSGRISDRHGVPSLIIAEFEGKFIGSGRSVEAFNIIEAAEKCKQYLQKFGGHAQALGFTIKDKESVQPFIDAMAALAGKALTGAPTGAMLEVEAEVTLESVNWQLFEDLEKFEPFGQENPKPRFLAKDLKVVTMQNLGATGNHLRLMVQHSSAKIYKTIGFSFGSWSEILKVGDSIDMVFEVDVNEWNGSRELQLKIVDLKKA